MKHYSSQLTSPHSYCLFTDSFVQSSHSFTGTNCTIFIKAFSFLTGGKCLGISNGRYHLLRDQDNTCKKHALMRRADFSKQIMCIRDICIVLRTALKETFLIFHLIAMNLSINCENHYYWI